MVVQDILARYQPPQPMHRLPFPKMGWMSLLTSAFWPIVVLIIFFVLRKPVAQLIPKLRDVKGPGGWELNFGEKASEAEKKSEALVSLTLRTGKDSSTDTTWADELRQIADVSPRAVVLEAFIRVEEQIVRLSRLRSSRPQGIMNAARTLARDGVIPEAVFSVLGELVYLRNQAAHSAEFQIPVTAALDYLNAAENVVSVLAVIQPTLQ